MASAGALACSSGSSAGPTSDAASTVDVGASEASAAETDGEAPIEAGADGAVDGGTGGVDAGGLDAGIVDGSSADGGATDGGDGGD
jgi:hypothetical protein